MPEMRSKMWKFEITATRTARVTRRNSGSVASRQVHSRSDQVISKPKFQGDLIILENGKSIRLRWPTDFRVGNQSGYSVHQKPMREGRKGPTDCRLLFPLHDLRSEDGVPASGDDDAAAIDAAVHKAKITQFTSRKGGREGRH